MGFPIHTGILSRIGKPMSFRSLERPNVRPTTAERQAGDDGPGSECHARSPGPVDNACRASADKGTLLTVDDLLAMTLAAGRGTITTRELTSIGVDRHEITRLIKGEVIQRVRPGVYVDAAEVARRSVGQRHMLASRAVLRTLPGYALTHQSAALAWGLRLLQADLGPVHVARIGKGWRRELPGVQVHAAVASSDVAHLRGVALVRPELAVCQMARAGLMRSGLAAADHGLAQGLLTSEELEARIRKDGDPAATLARLASPLSESAGESLTRLVFDVLTVPQPEQQVEIRDEQGRFVARVDFLFRESRLVVEFDGLAKYAGAKGPEALAAEKRREDELRRLGYRVVRLVWADLFDPIRVRNLLGF